MPIRMDISPIDRLVVIVARGPVSPEEIAEKTTTLVAANVPGYAKIIDVTGSSSHLTRDQVERIAALFRGGPEAPSRGAVAFVVNPDRRSLRLRDPGRAADRTVQEPARRASMVEERRPGRVAARCLACRRPASRHSACR